MITFLHPQKSRLDFFVFFCPNFGRISVSLLCLTYISLIFLITVHGLEFFRYFKPKT